MSEPRLSAPEDGIEEAEHEFERQHADVGPWVVEACKEIIESAAFQFPKVERDEVAQQVKDWAIVELIRIAGSGVGGGK